MLWLGMSCSVSGGVAGAHGGRGVELNTPPPEAPSDMVFPLSYLTVPPHKLICCFFKQRINVF